MSADRDLLFGLLALRTGLVGRGQLLDAMSAWLKGRRAALAECLRERALIGEEDYRLIDALVSRHASRHGGDAGGLDALTGGADVRRELQRLADERTDGGEATIPDQTPRESAPIGRPAAERYRAVRFHARGGLGEVHVAHDEELGREVALKRLRRELADDPASRARFVREAVVTGHLDHPGIVAVHGLVHDADGRPEYAMRLLRGETLQGAIQGYHRLDTNDLSARSLRLRELLTRFIAVCHAVAYAHSRDVVHRDLKPTNVMLGDFGETLVVDWGLARILQAAGGDGAESTLAAAHPILDADSEMTRKGQVLGTLAFLPPEQARGEIDQVGPLTDVWALGGLLYAILTGKPPYTGQGALDLAKEGRFDPPRQLNRATPPALEAVCLKAMAADPAHRYEGAQDVADEVGRWLADEPILACREPLRDRARRWARRRRTLVTAIAALLVAGAVGLGLGLWAVSAQKYQTELERDRAVRAEGEASTNLLHSQENLALARRALDECFNVAKDNPLFQQPRMEKARRLLLERTLDFYKNFRALRPGDIGLRKEEAAQWYRVASIEELLLRFPESEAAYGKSKELFGQLALEYPAETEYQLNLADIHQRLAVLWQQNNKTREALEELRRSQAILAKVVAENPEKDRYRYLLGSTHQSLGILTRRLGRFDDAQAEYAAAQRIFAPLVGTSSESDKAESALATTHNNLGNLFADLKRPEESLRELRKARTIHARIAAAFPTDAARQIDYARTLSNLSIGLRLLERREEALAEAIQAKKIRSALAVANPDLPEYQQGLAMIHNNLGIILKDLNRGEDALAEYREALRINRMLTATYPAATDYPSELGGTLVNLSIMQRLMGRDDEARASAGEAVSVLAAVHAKQPRHPVYRAFLRNAHASRARALGALKRHGEAVADWDEAVRLDATASARAATALLRAECLARAGSLARAAAEADTLSRSAAPFELARVHALLAAGAAQDGSLPLPRRESLVERHARAAVALLRASGGTDKAKGDADFAALLNRDDFPR